MAALRRKGTTLTTTYYASSQRNPPLLLRRIHPPGRIIDEAYLNGAWQPTKNIIDFMFGHDDFVDEVSEDEARRLEQHPRPAPQSDAGQLHQCRRRRNPLRPPCECI